MIINYIYKTDKYKIFFFIINKQIILYTIFYIIFCFTIKKTTKDYI